MRFLIVIPALNEARAIRGVVTSALQQSSDVLLVDDGSTDGTAALIADLPVRVLRHDSPHGKGNSLREAFALAHAEGYDAVVTMDGDGQHLASDIPRLLAAARQYPDRIVIGARMLNRECAPARNRRANAVADWGVSWACGQRIVDSQSGQRLYPRGVLALAGITTRLGFVFESEILIEASWRLGMRTVSVPIATRYPADRRASHFRGVRDTTRITRMIVWRILRRGLLLGNLVRAHREPATIVDPPPVYAVTGSAA